MTRMAASWAVCAMGSSHPIAHLSVVLWVGCATCGGTQGMNFLCSVLISQLPDEESVFWVFASIIGAPPAAPTTPPSAALTVRPGSCPQRTSSSRTSTPSRHSSLAFRSVRVVRVNHALTHPTLRALAELPDNACLCVWYRSTCRQQRVAGPDASPSEQHPVLHAVLHPSGGPRVHVQLPEPAVAHDPVRHAGRGALCAVCHALACLVQAEARVVVQPRALTARHTLLRHASDRYVHAVPDETVLRIWDAMFYEVRARVYSARCCVVTRKGRRPALPGC